MDRYESVLKKKFLKQIQDIYKLYLYKEKEAERTRDRKQYRELMQYFKKIRRYPRVKEKAAEIAENWWALYYGELWWMNCRRRDFRDVPLERLPAEEL